jgi:chromosome partitioning protein
VKTIAIANHKGGTCKTTTAVSLAAALVELGHRVVLIDLDPQASATKWLGHAPDGTGLIDVLTDGASLDSVIVPTAVDGLELVPAAKALGGGAADRQLPGEPGIQTALRDAIAKMTPRDFVLLDCPPNLGIIVVIALTAANDIIVPVAVGSQELAGLADLVHTFDRVRQRLNPRLRIAGVLTCRVDVRGRNTSRIAAEVVAVLRKHFPAEALATVIHESTRFKEAPSHHLPINQFDEGGRGAQDYLAVARELFARQKEDTRA